MYSIPDDEAGKYLPIHHRRRKACPPIAKWAAQRSPATNKKPTVLAMEEVRRGLVPYTDLELAQLTAAE